ncbi:MAG: integrase arm-type DNA-binding domain-containing protein [Pseudomonadota bacterium]
MARTTTPLTVAEVKNAKAETKSKRLFDGRGLYLEVTPKGGKYWRFKYRFENREKRISLGTFPEITLAEARDRREEARRQVAHGIDPSAVRKAQASANKDSFEAIAAEWMIQKEKELSPGHLRTIRSRLDRDILPFLGKSPITKITAPDVLSALRRVENRGAIESAHRIKTIVSQVFRYAISTGQAVSNPARDLGDALPKAKAKHFPAITKPTEVAELLKTIENYKGTLIVSTALKLAPLVFVRPGELRHAKWEEIDLESAEWRFIATKTNTEHIVPLATQAVSLLEKIQMVTDRGPYVFPSARTPKGTRPMSDNALLAAFRRLGIPKERMTVHGFRAMARTLLDEELGFAPHLIEHQLAHAVRDPLGRAYNRTAHLNERRAMMQAWADYLEKLPR